MGCGRRAGPRGRSFIAGGRRPQVARRPRGVPFQRQLDDPQADGGERVAGLRRHRREEADRREARDRVDLREEDPLAAHQEVDPGEALRADRAIGVAGSLCMTARSTSVTSARVEVSDRPGRVLRRVVVELAAGDDLARTVDLEARVVVADDRHLEVAGIRQVALDDREVVVAEREIERRRAAPRRRGRASSRPTLPSRAGLTMSRGSAPPAAKAVSSAHGRRDRPSSARRGPRASRRPAARCPRHSRLKSALSMPDRRRGDTRSGVRQAGRLEQRLDRPVLAERSVQGDEHDRCRLARRRGDPARRRPRAGPGPRACAARRTRRPRARRGGGRRQPPPARRRGR